MQDVIAVQISVGLPYTPNTYIIGHIIILLGLYV